MPECSLAVSAEHRVTIVIGRWHGVRTPDHGHLRPSADHGAGGIRQHRRCWTTPRSDRPMQPS